MMEPGVLLLALPGIAKSTVLGLGVLKTVNRHLDRKAELERSRLPAPPADDPRVELEDLRIRLGEVEERLDFTERLLAKEHPQERLKSS